VDGAADAEVLCGLVSGDLGAGVLELLEEAGLDEAGVAGDPLSLVPGNLGAAEAALDGARSSLASLGPSSALPLLGHLGVSGL